MLTEVKDSGDYTAFVRACRQVFASNAGLAVSYRDGSIALIALGLLQAGLVCGQRRSRLQRAR
jgi:hypothetical protein